MTRGISVHLCALLIGVHMCPSRVVTAQVFRTTRDVVRVDVLVTEGNRPVAGLTAADFEILDNGMAQTVDQVSIEEVPFSALLALDVSESMAGAPLNDLKAAADSAVGALRATDRAAIMTFADQVREAAGWLPSGPALTSAIDHLRAIGSTALFDAAFAALTLRDPEPGRRALVLFFSDGDDTASWLPGAAALDRAGRTDAVVYTVSLGADRDRAARDRRTGSAMAGPGVARLALRSGITLSPNAPIVDPSPFLPELAQRTGGESITVASSNKLRETFERIVREFGSRYLLTYTPRDVNTPGWHRVEVKVKAPRLSVKARRGYTR